MKSTFFILLLLISATHRAQQGESLNALISEWASDSDLSHATVGCYVINLSDGEVLADFRGEKSMIPASLMKVPVTVAALDEAGSQKVFKTMLSYSGEIKDGVLNGDVYFSGEGDPSLGSFRIDGSPDEVTARFASAFQQKGISAINGNVLVVESVPAEPPGTWTWEDLSNYYAAVPHSINFLENRFSVEFQTGAPGSLARIVSVNPVIEGLEIGSEVVAADVSGDETFCFGHPSGNEIVIKGKLPANRQSFTVKGAIPQPALYFAQRVMESAVKSGLRWSGEFVSVDAVVQDKPRLIYMQESPALGKLVALTNQHSINLFAESFRELLLREWQQDDWSEGMKQYWKDKLPGGVSGMDFRDGSGLSHFNLITPRQLCEMLHWASKQPFAADFEQSMPQAGKSGTLRHFGKGTSIEGNFFGKSGYMTGNRGYAGYLRVAPGHKIAVVLMVNHYDLPSAAMRNKIELLFNSIAAQF